MCGGGDRGGGGVLLIKLNGHFNVIHIKVSFAHCDWQSKH